MKKTNVLLFCIICCIFIFAGCEGANILKLDPKKPIIENTSPVVSSETEEQKEDMPEKSSSIPFKVGVTNNSYGSRNGHELLTVVRSRKELDTAASTRFYQYGTGKGELLNAYYLAELTEKYNEDFFEENALVLFLFISGSGGGSIEIYGMQKQDNELTIMTDYHPGMLAVISYWTVVIETAQADVSDINSIEIKNECICPPPPVTMVSVILTHEATVEAFVNQYAYTPKDFPELELSIVQNLFDYCPGWSPIHETAEERKQCNDPSHIPEVYNRILFLYLANPADRNDENLIKAVQLIKQRKDVEAVSGW